MNQDVEREVRSDLSFWRWFVREGLQKFVDFWLIVHVVVGLALALALPSRLSDVAKAALIPLAAVLVGLAFAWSGSAAGLLQSQPLQRVGAQNAGTNFRNLAFTYQAAVLVVLTSVVLWSLIAGGASDVVVASQVPRIVGRTLIFALSSLTVRECWQITLGVQKTLIIHARVSAETSAADKPTPPAAQLPERNALPLEASPVEAVPVKPRDSH